ncbi:MAG: hypothetical protein EAZ52_02115 [Alphaproteobacteria bacterium]|nr:MAG: hypothetical protein EAZ52_02115 [Alphaproteobacteria bacterium]
MTIDDASFPTTQRNLTDDEIHRIFDAMVDRKNDAMSTYASMDFDERVAWQKHTFLDKHTASFSLVSGNQMDDALNLLVNDERMCASVMKLEEFSGAMLERLKDYMQSHQMLIQENEYMIAFARTQEALEAMDCAMALPPCEEKWRTLGVLFGYDQEKIDFFVSHVNQDRSPIHARIQEEYDQFCAMHDAVMPVDDFIAHQEKQWHVGIAMDGQAMSAYPVCVIEARPIHQGRIVPTPEHQATIVV